MNTLYLDMDGVVADFDEYAHRMLGVPPSGGIYPDEIWQQLAANPRIYRDLKKTPGADDLVAMCKELCKDAGYNLKFLTAVPKGNDVPWAFYDKMTWALFFFPDIPVMFGPYSKDKHHHCKPGDILIHCGDLYDNRTSIPIIASYKAEKILLELSKILPLHIIVGNHDLWNKGTNDINIFNYLNTNLLNCLFVFNHFCIFLYIKCFLFH